MIVSKEEFVEIINRLKETDEVICKVNNIFDNVTDNIMTCGSNATHLMICHEDIVVKLLEKIFNDKDVLTYWLYEKSYGRDYKKGDITVNGKKIDLSTPEKLYDFLIQNLEGNK